MHVFVTGGTGAIGSHVIPALLAEGHTVTGLARTPAKAAMLTRQGARAVAVSIFDRPALTAAVAGHDAIANLTSAIPPMTRLCVRRPGRPTTGSARKAQQLSSTLLSLPVSAG